ncbi:hypothetical protein [Vibrio mimicus]|uniref:hypothetical protein n=1 Tax=Vibrio mimicus TaxID=674 RepID=UPI000878BCA3|nr:hypothetical protein [Vibrio mimicus]AOW82305.1 hypothetical protein VM_06045 [Vibrio mimicus]
MTNTYNKALPINLDQRYSGFHPMSLAYEPTVPAVAYKLWSSLWFEFRNHVFFSATNPQWCIDVYYRSQTSICEFLGCNDKTLRKHAQLLRSIGWLRFVNTMGTNYWFPLSPADRKFNTAINALIDQYEVWIKGGRKDTKPNMSLKSAMKSTQPKSTPEEAMNTETKQLDTRMIGRLIRDEYGAEVKHFDYQQNLVVLDDDTAQILTNEHELWLLECHSALFVSASDYDTEVDI